MRIIKLLIYVTVHSSWFITSDEMWFFFLGNCRERLIYRTCLTLAGQPNRLTLDWRFEGKKRVVNFEKRETQCHTWRRRRRNTKVCAYKNIHQFSALYRLQIGTDASSRISKNDDRTAHLWNSFTACCSIIVNIIIKKKKKRLICTNTFAVKQQKLPPTLFLFCFLQNVWKINYLNTCLYICSREL